MNEPTDPHQPKGTAAAVAMGVLLTATVGCLLGGMLLTVLIEYLPR